MSHYTAPPSLTPEEVSRVRRHIPFSPPDRYDDDRDPGQRTARPPPLPVVERVLRCTRDEPVVRVLVLAELGHDQPAPAAAATFPEEKEGDIDKGDVEKHATVVTAATVATGLASPAQTPSTSVSVGSTTDGPATSLLGLGPLIDGPGVTASTSSSALPMESGTAQSDGRTQKPPLVGQWMQRGKGGHPTNGTVYELPVRAIESRAESTLARMLLPIGGWQPAQAALAGKDGQPEDAVPIRLPRPWIFQLIHLFLCLYPEPAPWATELWASMTATDKKVEKEGATEAKPRLLKRERRIIKHHIPTQSIRPTPARTHPMFLERFRTLGVAERDELLVMADYFQLPDFHAVLLESEERDPAYRRYQLTLVSQMRRLCRARSLLQGHYRRQSYKRYGLVDYYDPKRSFGMLREVGAADTPVWCAFLRHRDVAIRGGLSRTTQQRLPASKEVMQDKYHDVDVEQSSSSNADTPARGTKEPLSCSEREGVDRQIRQQPERDCKCHYSWPDKRDGRAEGVRNCDDERRNKRARDDRDDGHDGPRLRRAVYDLHSNGRRNSNPSRDRHHERNVRRPNSSRDSGRIEHESRGVRLTASPSSTSSPSFNSTVDSTPKHSLLATSSIQTTSVSKTSTEPAILRKRTRDAVDELAAEEVSDSVVCASSGHNRHLAKELRLQKRRRLPSTPASSTGPVIIPVHTMYPRHRDDLQAETLIDTIRCSLDAPVTTVSATPFLQPPASALTSPQALYEWAHTYHAERCSQPTRTNRRACKCNRQLFPTTETATLKMKDSRPENYVSYDSARFEYGELKQNEVVVFDLMVNTNGSMVADNIQRIR